MKFITLFLFFYTLLLQQAFCCKFSADFSEKVDNEQDFLDLRPVEAKYIYTGFSSGEGGVSGDTFLEIEKAWTPILNVKIRINGGMCPAGNYGLNKKYLFLSNDLTNPMFMKLIELSSARKFMEKLSLKKDFVGDINFAWQFCEKNLDCKTTINKCGIPVGINKIHEQNYLEFLKSKNSDRIDCKKESGKKATSIKNKCAYYFCE